MSETRSRIEAFKKELLSKSRLIDMEEYRRAKRDLDPEEFEARYSKKQGPSDMLSNYYYHELHDEDISDEELDLLLKIENYKLRKDYYRNSAGSLKVIKYAAALFLIMGSISLFFFVIALMG